jgi:type I restriction enzyme S subunit
MDTCIHDGLLALVDCVPEVSVEFLYYSFVWRKPQLFNVATHGGTYSNLTTTILKEFEFPIPPLAEQRRIAGILGAWDEAINLTGRLIEAKQRRKHGLMQRLLTGSVRLPGFEGEWREVRLGKIAELIAGATPSTRINEYWQNGNIRWMKSGEVHLKRIYDVEERITQQGLESSSTKLIPKDSVLIALAGQGITRGTVAINKIELCTNQSIAAIVPKAEVLYYEYLFYNLDSRYEEFRRLSSGDGGRGGLNLGLLRGVKVPVPPLPEQRAIAAVLQTADEAIALLERKLAALRRQKQGLMQRLLTGQVRVGEGE